MNGSALILAAHGSRIDTSVNDLVCEYVERLSGMNGFGEIVAAFHHGEPTFSTVLDGLEAESVTVVPLMTSRGYFSEVVLPRDLARNRRFRTIDVMQTEPVGTHPKIVSIVWQRVCDRMMDCGFAPDTASVILVGHGTSKYPRSTERTFQLADELSLQHRGCEVVAAFLDDGPTIEIAMEQVSRENVVVEPFFIADGPHVSRDIPGRLGLTEDNGNSLPFSGRVGKRNVVCDSALGTDSRIVDLILDLATQWDVRPKQLSTTVPAAAAESENA